MKKKLFCLLIAAVCLLPFVFTACGDDGEVEELGTKAITLNLYGITNESTTEEAIAAVQAEMNKYTEGKFNTHIVLHLYTEDEYYDVIDAKFAEIEKLKAEEEANKKGNKPSQKVTTEASTDAATETQNAETAGATGTAADTQVGGADETYVDDNGVVKSVYPDERATQLDIFMVQGATNLNKYFEKNYLNSLSPSLSNASKTLTKRISETMFAGATLGGMGNVDTGLVDSKGKVYGIPNNYIYGEYTYLLVKKDIADDYGYSANDLDSLKELANFLDDAAKDYSDHITLYNEPTLNAQYITEEESLMGAVIKNTNNGFTRLPPACLLNYDGYKDYIINLKAFKDAGYITEGSYYSMPVDENGEAKKVAAAFVKGDASLPAEYEDEYFVITYERPTANAEQNPGTMFCVSTHTLDLDRAMEIITALNTSVELRNTFQYGVENVHYEVDEYTGMINIKNNDYSMNMEDTGNLFILKPNSSMDEKMLKFAENDWALAKKQLSDTIIGPYCYFNYRVITEDNYKTDSYVYQEQYQEALAAAREAAKKKGEKFDEKTFVYDEPYKYRYTADILADLEELSRQTLAKLEAFEETVDENGKVITFEDYIEILYDEFKAADCYKEFTNTANLDSPRIQYITWNEKVTPKV